MRSLSLLAFFILAMTGETLASQAVPLAPDAEKTGLCDVMKSPGAFSEHHVMVQGIVMGEHTDRLLIMWPECQFGMHLIISKEIESHADVQKLFQAVRQGNPGTTDRDITRWFTGVFHYAAAGSVYELRVEKIAPSPPYKDPNL